MRIDVKALRQELGGAEILHGVDLTFEDGVLTGVLGPNGSGKSTLLRCVYRAARPSGGSIFFDGRDISGMPNRETARLAAVMAQQAAFPFEFTVEQMVLMGRTPHKRLLEGDDGRDFGIVDAALELVGLAGMDPRAFSTLSGGEQQRALMARALAQDTGTLILDEPTNHLDITYQLQLMRLVKRLGKTVVMAVHDLNIAAMYCDDLYVMRAGEVVAHGSPAAILTPGLIRDVYGVEAEVSLDDAYGIVRVRYAP